MAKIKLSTLTAGKYYKKGDIVGNILPALSIVEGELCFFLTEKNKDGLKNSVVKRGIVWQPRHNCQLVIGKNKPKTQLHVFYRTKQTGPFKYMGTSTHMEFIGKNQNLLVIPKITSIWSIDKDCSLPE